MELVKSVCRFYAMKLLPIVSFKPILYMAFTVFSLGCFFFNFSSLNQLLMIADDLPTPHEPHDLIAYNHPQAPESSSAINSHHHHHHHHNHQNLKTDKNGDHLYSAAPKSYGDKSYGEDESKSQQQQQRWPQEQEKAPPARGVKPYNFDRYSAEIMNKIKYIRDQSDDDDDNDDDDDDNDNDDDDHDHDRHHNHDKVKSNDDNDDNDNNDDNDHDHHDHGANRDLNHDQLKSNDDNDDSDNDDNGHDHDRGANRDLNHDQVKSNYEFNDKDNEDHGHNHGADRDHNHDQLNSNDDNDDNNNDDNGDDDDDDDAARAAAAGVVINYSSNDDASRLIIKDQNISSVMITSTDSISNDSAAMNYNHNATTNQHDDDHDDDNGGDDHQDQIITSILPNITTTNHHNDDDNNDHYADDNQNDDSNDHHADDNQNDDDHADDNQNDEHSDHHTDDNQSDDHSDHRADDNQSDHHSDHHADENQNDNQSNYNDNDDDKIMVMTDSLHSDGHVPSPKQEEEEEEHHTAKNLCSSTKNPMGSCDLTKGRWVRDETPPPYSTESCSFIHGNQDCVKNGRPDTEYLHWRWQPSDCSLPRFDATVFLQHMRNKKMLFVGDSLARNHMESLFCTLTQVDHVDVGAWWEHMELVNFTFPSYNFTLGGVWAPFLVKHEPEAPGSPNMKLHIDQLHELWVSTMNNYDVVVFSGAYWLYRPSIYYMNNQNVSLVDPDDPGYPQTLTAMKLVWKNVFDHVLSSYNGTVVLRTLSISHFESSSWDHGGSCNKTQPNLMYVDGNNMVLEWQHNEVYRLQRDAFVKAVAENEKRGHGHLRLRLLDVTSNTLLRPDAHPGIYRVQKSSETRYDCLHWCLPGPMDTWNQLLLADPQIMCS